MVSPSPHSSSSSPDSGPLDLSMPAPLDNLDAPLDLSVPATLNLSRVATRTEQVPNLPPSSDLPHSLSAGPSVSTPVPSARSGIDRYCDEYRRVERERARANVAAETAEQREARLSRRRATAAERRERDRSSVPHVQLLNHGFRYDPSYDYSQHPALNFGKMVHICRFCQAKTFKSEAKGLCCSSGKVNIQPIEQPPEPILSLFAGDIPETRTFIDELRAYNSCFQMTSFGVKGTIFNDPANFSFKVQGQVYHRIGSLVPNPSDQPDYLQVYFMGDSEAQLSHRMSKHRGTRRAIMINLQEMLDNHNELIRNIKTAFEQLEADDHQVVIRADKTPAGEHERRFNAPSVDETAIVVIDNGCDHRDIMIRRRDNSLHRINENHRSYDALQYPLIFWRGRDSFHLKIHQVDPRTRQPTNRTVTHSDYYCHQMMVRSEEQNFLLKCGPLLNQFLVDMYAKVEYNRLKFIRDNQSSLRADSYIHLKDALENDDDAADIGRRVILPSTFVGSPRHMQEYAQDAMAYVQRYGRPDLFITFTCNNNWPEITENLFANQKAKYRHDITARVFNQKVAKLKHVLVNQRLFGPVRCYMYSIEWQKRGLPHTHMLIWLAEKIIPDMMDQVISAELPDPESDPMTHSIVAKHLIHTSCGPASHGPSKDVCLDAHKRCSKKFPRQFLNETLTEGDGYPLYRRRSPLDGGHTTLLRGVTIDNRWVVPHNRVLTRMFNAHINVEYCHSVKAIKYICKYINKGGDMAVVQLNNINRHDEVTCYQLGRYISTNEAAWRLIKFKIHDRHPAVFHLQVHLENGQRVYFNESNAQQIADNPRNTTLTAFFLLCQQDDFAKTFVS